MLGSAIDAIDEEGELVRSQLPTGQGARAGERTLDASGGGAVAGQSDAQVGGLVKLVAPSRRRVAVEPFLQEGHAVSQRRACRLLAQPRDDEEP